MKSAQSTLRVSHLTYIRVMDALIAEVATLTPAEAVAIISAVTAYIHSAEGVEAGDNEILRRYFDIIDRAAVRSARARQAALNRRKTTQTPTKTPTQASTETPTEAPADLTSIQNSKFPIPNSSPATSIQNSKSPIQNSTRPRIKIKHKSRSNDRRKVGTRFNAMSLT